MPTRVPYIFALAKSLRKPTQTFKLCWIRTSKQVEPIVGIVKLSLSISIEVVIKFAKLRSYFDNP